MYEKLAHFMSLTFALEIVVSLMFLLNKILLFLGTRSGWYWGAAAAFLSIYYFFRVHLFVFVIMEVGLTLLMVYAGLSKDRRSSSVEVFVNLVLVAVMSAMVWYAAFGTITLLQLVAALAILLGTHLLAREKEVSGWLCYFVTHTITAYLFFETGQVYAMIGQVLSALISLVVIADRPSHNINNSA